MNDSFGHLMERNLREVSGQRDSKRHKIAISELYKEDCTFFEAEDQIIGRDALCEKVEHILQNAPGFVFGLVGTPQVNHVKPVEINPGAWDDIPNPTITFWGLYASNLRWSPRFMPDVYFLDYDAKSAMYSTNPRESSGA